MFAASVGGVFSAILLLFGMTAMGHQVILAFVGNNNALANGIQPVLLLCAFVPFIISCQNAIQGLLISDAKTGHVNIATWIGTTTLILVAWFSIRSNIPGATAAATAMVTALLAETLWLAFAVWINHRRGLTKS